MAMYPAGCGLLAWMPMTTSTRGGPWRACQGKRRIHVKKGRIHACPENTCMSCEEEDTCLSRKAAAPYGTCTSTTSLTCVHTHTHTNRHTHTRAHALHTHTRVRKHNTQIPLDSVEIETLLQLNLWDLGLVWF